MVFARLVEFIEAHWMPITNGIVHRIQADPKLPHLSRLPPGDLEDMGRNLVRNLGHWLMTANRTEVAIKFEDLGRQRFQQAVPLHEVVWALLLVKETLVDYVRQQGFAQSSVEIYAEEELEHRVDEFFDTLTYYLVRGYEAELRALMHHVATA